MDHQLQSDIECFIILEEILSQQFLVMCIFLFMVIHGLSIRRNRHVVRYLMSSRVPKIISHLNYIRQDSDTSCIDKLRMDRNSFHTLVLLTKKVGGLTDMSLGFLIDVDEDESENEASHGPNAPTEEAENAYTGPNFIGAFENEYATGSPHEHTETSGKKSEYSKRTSSSANEKEKSKKRKRVEDVNETFLKTMAEVMKDFTESQDKRIGSLIDKIGNRDHSDMRAQIYSIIESPTFDLYTIEQRIKAKRVICGDVKNMKIFLRMAELERQTMMYMVINDQL